MLGKPSRGTLVYSMLKPASPAVPGIQRSQDHPQRHWRESEPPGRARAFSIDSRSSRPRRVCRFDAARPFTSPSPAAPKQSCVQIVATLVSSHNHWHQESCFSWMTSILIVSRNTRANLSANRFAISQASPWRPNISSHKAFIDWMPLLFPVPLIETCGAGDCVAQQYGQVFRQRLPHAGCAVLKWIL